MRTGNALAVLVPNAKCEESLRSSGRFRLLRRADLAAARREPNVIVVAAASELPAVAPFVREANRRHHLRALLVHADLDERWMTQLLDRAGVRTLSNLLVVRGDAQFRRIVEAWRAGAQNHLIADALALSDRLLVVTCALERLEVPFSAVGPLAAMSEAERKDFQIDPDGAHLCWRGPDVHLDLDSLRFAIDDGARERAALEGAQRNRRIGAAIASLRRSRGLIPTDCEAISARQLRRLELGQCVPRKATLERLAAAHAMTLSEYLDSLAEASHLHILAADRHRRRQ